MNLADVHHFVFLAQLKSFDRESRSWFYVDGKIFEQLISRPTPKNP